MTPAWYCYILRCADGSLYTGISTDVARRLEQHNAGVASRYTRTRRPVQLAWIEPCADRGAATRREGQIKRMTRAQKLRIVGGKETEG